MTCIHLHAVWMCMCDLFGEICRDRTLKNCSKKMEIFLKMRKEAKENRKYKYETVIANSQFPSDRSSSSSSSFNIVCVRVNDSFEIRSLSQQWQNFPILIFFGRAKTSHRIWLAVNLFEFEALKMVSFG